MKEKEKRFQKKESKEKKSRREIESYYDVASVFRGVIWENITPGKWRWDERIVARKKGPCMRITRTSKQSWM